MKRPILAPFLALFLLACAVTARAQADVYVCVDAAGKKEYKNTGATKGCRKIDLPDLTLIPAPPKRIGVQSTSAKPATNERQAAATPTPSDFPKIDSGVQRARDNDRRQILMDEMRKEEQKLAELRREYNNGEPERRGDERNYAKYQERVALLKEDIDRSEKNIEALKRELNNSR